MQFMITAKAGFTRGSTWLVDQKPLTIGRSYRCDIVVDDGTVSRQHCRVTKDPEGVRLEDMGSRNPALVDGIPKTDAVLPVGGEFSVGKAVFLVTAVASTGGSAEYRRPDSDTISVDLDDLGLDSVEQHSSWPGTSADYVLLFRFGRVCSHLKSESALESQMQEILVGRFGPSRVHLFDGGDGLTPEVVRRHQLPDVLPETADRAVEERRAFAMTGAGRAQHTFVAPLFHTDIPLGVAVLELDALDPESDQEMILTLFSALCEVVGPYVQAAREHDRLVELNKRLSSPDLDPRMPIVGRSAVMSGLRSLVLEAARTPLNVLVTGETGTGKELVAEAIHLKGGRADKPYIVVNCAAIPANLLESELFGHERGAFTGAQAAKRGLLALADGGVLFLDEVGDLSPENQARMLRVLEQGTFRPVGATREERVDVRVVAATNRSVEDDAFRSDLFHRLAGFTISVPALRKRKEDIPELAQYFLDQVAAKDERLIHVFSDEALDVLKEYDWPGNVRELRNVVGRIAHRTPTALISAEDIWRDGHVNKTKGRDEGPLNTLAEMEREHILRALRSCDGNRTRSAKILGISRSTLYLKLAEYGVDA